MMRPRMTSVCCARRADTLAIRAISTTVSVEHQRAAMRMARMMSVNVPGVLLRTRYCAALQRESTSALAPSGEIDRSIASEPDDVATEGNAHTFDQRAFGADDVVDELTGLRLLRRRRKHP